MKKTSPTRDYSNASSSKKAAAQPDTLPAQWLDDILKAVEVMRSGGIILYPTDTIWGIGCDAENTTAVEKVFALKERADSKALISLVDSDGRLQRYVRDVPEVAWQITDLALRPITIVYDDVNGLSPRLLAEDGSAGIRITREAFSRELCRRFGKAIVSTSANISGMPAPRRFQDIDKEILEKVDYACRSRRKEKAENAASSVIKVGKDGTVSIIRR